MTSLVVVGVEPAVDEGPKLFPVPAAGKLSPPVGNNWGKVSAVPFATSAPPLLRSPVEPLVVSPAGSVPELLLRSVVESCGAGNATTAEAKAKAIIGE